jgi:hypothetical protein
MEYVKIPLPDFAFADIAKRLARNTAMTYVTTGSIKSFALATNDYKERFKTAIKADVNGLSSKEDVVVYISEFFSYLFELQSTISNANQLTITIINSLNDLRYFLYSLSKSVGYDFDKTGFLPDEVIDLNSKVDSIIETLEKLKAGQEVIFDHMDEVIGDYSSLKSDYPLGKRRWYQRAAGIVVSYAGEKGADELYEAIKPTLATLIKHTPKIIEKLLN